MSGTLRIVAKVLARLRPYRWAFTGAILQVLLSGLLELAKPWPLKIVVDNVLGGHPLAFRELGTLPPGLLLVACGLLVPCTLPSALAVTATTPP